MLKSRPTLSQSLDKISPFPSQPRNPPAWLNRSAYWFRLGLILFSVLALLFGTNACSFSSFATTIPSSWQRATEITSTETLVQLVQSHSSLSIPDTVVKTMKVWSINGKKGKFNLYDFHHPSLCGQIGCLYVGYLIPFDKSQLPKEVFTAYLNPNLPPKIPLFQAEAESTFLGMPCLLVNQPSREGQRRLEFCYNGLAYQLVNNQLFKREEGAPEAGEQVS